MGDSLLRARSSPTSEKECSPCARFFLPNVPFLPLSLLSLLAGPADMTQEARRAGVEGEKKPLLW